MSSVRVAALSLLLGIFFGMLANVVLAVMPGTAGARPRGFVFPLGATLGFFLFYRTTFAYSWNRRAARLDGKSAR